MKKHFYKALRLVLVTSTFFLFSKSNLMAQCTAPSSTVVANTNCIIPTGTITFTGPLPVANYQYSIDGGITFGAPGQVLFTNLPGGTYPTVSKLISTGCISPINNKNISNPAVASPVSVVVNSSSCVSPDGSIRFTAPTPLANFQFSIDGGVTFGAPGVVLFNGLAGGTYPTIVKSVLTGCTSATITKTILNPLEAGSDQSICLNQSVTMSASTGAPATWSAAAGNPSSTSIAAPGSPTTTITGFTKAGTYTFTFSNAGCSKTMSVIVSGCSSPLPCGAAYLLQTNNPGTSNTDFISVDIPSGVKTPLYTSIVSAPYSINAVGYNVTDGELWGSLQNTNLAQGVVGTGTIVQIGADGIPHNYSIPGLYNNGYNVGTVDANGVLYLYLGNETTVFKVDVNPASPTYLTLIGTFNIPSVNISDFAYNPIDGFLYATGNDAPHKLYKINPATGAFTTVGNVTGGAVFTNGNFGAAYFDMQGNFYMFDNQSGNTYVVNAVQNITGNTSPQLISAGTPSSGNDGALCTNACVFCSLPVNIIQFNGLKDNGGVKLNWQLASEINVAEMVIEKSINGGDTWAMVANIAATDNQHSHSIYDNNIPEGKILYRLKIIDESGQYSYSNILLINSAASSASVFPNPATDKITITGLTKKNTIKIVNAAGQILLTTTVAATTYQADVSKYPSGLYILLVQENGKEAQVIKLIKE